jgi:hypothetical protein
MDSKTLEFEALGRKFTARYSIAALVALEKVDVKTASGAIESFRLLIRDQGQPIDFETAVAIVDALGPRAVGHIVADAYELAWPNAARANRAPLERTT